MKKIKTRYKVIIAVAAVLIIVRLILPYIVLKYANERLAEINGYFGHIEDIDLSFYRGAYTIDEIYINKVDTVNKVQTDFFKAEAIDLSVEWNAIFNGSIVGELEFESPVLIFTKDKVELGSVKEDTTDFRKLLNDFMPLKINRFEVMNGSIHYADKTSKPKVDVSLIETSILALNLSNVINDNILLPSTVTASAKAYEGTLDFNMKLNALAEQTTFDLNAEIKNVNLVLLNDFLKAYGKFDVNKGNIALYTEVSAKEGRFKGYVKPIIKDLDVLGPEDRSDNFFQEVWEGAVGTVGVLFKNQKEDQLATKVEMNGKFNDPKIRTLDAIFEVLKNAFIQALMPAVDNEININSVDSIKSKSEKGLLKKVFSKKDKNDKREKRR